MKEQYALFKEVGDGDYEQQTVWLSLEDTIKYKERGYVIFKQVWDIENERQLCSKALTDVQQS